jgi:16S rRNA (cytidine1402-2'-O)-methyltransferase
LSTLLKPGLYIVATPIGHLGDITERARTVLSSAQFILCEDTRQTKKLLNHYDLFNQQRLLCANEHTEHTFKDFITRSIAEGSIIALVSDAGTPALCDPGHRLIAFARQAQLPIIPVPGASALTTFLCCIGADPQPIHFIGFLPRKEQAIIDKLQSMRSESQLLVFFESPQRIGKTLQIFSRVLPHDTTCFIGRELTKLYEQIWTGPLGSLIEMIGSTIPERGEFIMAMALPKTLSERWHEAARSLVPILGVKKTSQWISEHFDVRKNQVYDFLT